MRIGALKMAAMLAAILLTYCLMPVAPAAADNLCKPSGKDGAIALPKKLVTANRPQEDKYTTADVEPLSSVNIDALGLRTPRTLTVGTQPGGPPTSCLNSAGRFTGYDNELLRAIAEKLGLRVVFAGTEFAGLWGGGTVPGWRRRGIYRALVGCRARLAAERGYRYLTVDASPESRPILERTGFSCVAITTPHIWSPESARS